MLDIRHICEILKILEPLPTAPVQGQFPDLVATVPEHLGSLATSEVYVGMIWDGMWRHAGGSGCAEYIGEGVRVVLPLLVPIPPAPPTLLAPSPPTPSSSLVIELIELQPPCNRNRNEPKDYLPQNRHEGPDGKKLVRCSSIGLKLEDNRGRDGQG
jgi:hypothetical protein